MGGDYDGWSADAHEFEGDASVGHTCNRIGRASEQSSVPCAHSLVHIESEVTRHVSAQRHCSSNNEKN